MLRQPLRATQPSDSILYTEAFCDDRGSPWNEWLIRLEAAVLFWGTEPLKLLLGCSQNETAVPKRVERGSANHGTITPSPPYRSSIPEKHHT